MNGVALGDSSKEGKLWKLLGKLANKQQGAPGNSTQLLKAIHMPFTMVHPWLQRYQRPSFPNPTRDVGAGPFWHQQPQ